MILLRPDEQRITAIVELGDSPHTGEEAGKQPTDDRERWCQRNLVNMVLSRIEWFVDEIVNLVGRKRARARTRATIRTMIPGMVWGR